MITLCAKLNRNLRYRVLFRDFFGRSVVECPSNNEQLLDTLVAHIPMTLFTFARLGGQGPRCGFSQINH